MKYIVYKYFKNYENYETIKLILSSVTKKFYKIDL